MAEQMALEWNVEGAIVQLCVSYVVVLICRPRVSVRREVGPACADVWRGGGSTCADVWRTGWSACADIWQMCNAVFFFPLCIFEHLTGERRITAPGPHTQLFGGARH